MKENEEVNTMRQIKETIHNAIFLTDSFKTKEDLYEFRNNVYEENLDFTINERRYIHKDIIDELMYEGMQEETFWINDIDPHTLSEMTKIKEDKVNELIDRGHYDVIKDLIFDNVDNTKEYIIECFLEDSGKNRRYFFETDKRMTYVNKKFLELTGYYVIYLGLKK